MIPGSANPLLLKSAAAAGGYQIERSLRFNSSDSAYLSRTPAVAGNRRTWTWAGWVKRSGLGAFQSLFCCIAPNLSHYLQFTIESDDCLLLYDLVATSGVALKTTQVLRDPSAWYHIVLQYNTTNATASNKVKLYVNGSEITQFSIDNRSSLTSDSSVNRAEQHSISGRQPYSTEYFNGYLADVHFIDGQALTPSSFTEVSATTGQLIPKAYTGTYTGNSFWLKFNDNSAATAATLGKDSFLLGNNWTPNNLSVTAGAGNDSLVDTPTSFGTDTGVGGEVRGNYATLNPLDNGGLTLANGNLDFSRATASWVSSRSTFGVSSGKWYWEVTLFTGNDCMAGISKNDAALSSYFASVSNGWAYNAQNGQKYNNGSASAYGNSWVGGNDTVGVAFDADAGSIYFYKNGAVQNSGNAAFTGLTSGPYFPSVALYGTGTAFINFGQRSFAYQTPGTNRPAATYKALCDTNLGAPLVAKPSTVFDVITYTGTGSSLTLPNGSSTPTSISFTPDFAWLKGRSGATDHALYDAVRGVQKDLVSNSTSAETTETTGLTAFGTNTFTVGSLAKLNTSSSTYVAWAWNAGGSTVSNTAGSITSQVRANASAGFSVVTYTGTGSNATVGHGLGVAPALFIVKRRDSAANWIAHTTVIDGSYDYLYLNLTNAKADSGLSAPTSTIFQVGNGLEMNGSGATYVGYCFAPVVGYSSFGSYVGNGSSDGPFVYTGFRPRWILLKSTVANGASWTLFDTARNTYNQTDAYLFANASIAEGNAFPIDILSNGFKLRTSDGLLNGSTYTYIYAAFAENPFQYARAR